MIDLDSMEDSSNKRLLLACQSGNDRAARKALEEGAHPQCIEPISGHCTPLLIATLHGHAKIVEMLLPLSNPHATDGSHRTALMLACIHGGLACAKILAPCSHPKSLDSRGDGALHLAALHGHEAIVELLLNSAGFDPFEKNHLGETALMKAASSANLALVAMLLPRSDAMAASDHGSTLSYACKTDKNPCLDFLLPIATPRPKAASTNTAR